VGQILGLAVTYLKNAARWGSPVDMPKAASTSRPAVET
jgi:hypothetical protein